MKYTTQFAGRTDRISSGTNLKKYLTIHETANKSKGADAQAHANLQKRPGNYQASWHWQVDDTQAIQSYRHSAKCWHAGNAKGNAESIGVEICVNSDGNWAQTRANAVKLAAKILREEKIPVERMVQHNYWSGKNCPTNLRANNNAQWNQFVADVKKELQGGATPPPTVPDKQGQKHTVKKGETLSGIAKQYGVGVGPLASANRLADPNKIYVGQVLSVPVPQEQSKPKPPAPAQGTVLRQGSKGSAVGTLQRGLNKSFPAYSKLTVDNIFGAATTRSVKEFQRRSKLVADGIVGVATKAALKKYGINL